MDAQSLASHNNRVSQIRKFVTRPPARAKTLRLVVTHPTQQTLGEWIRSQCENNANVAVEISEALQEHSNVSRRRIEASLGWLDDATPIGVVSSKTLKARPSNDDEDEDDTGDLATLGIDGTPMGQVVQMQRHMEVMAKSYFVAHQAQIVTANELTRAVYDENRSLHTELARLRSAEVELQALKASIALAEQAEAGEDTVGPETDAARAQLINTTLEGLKKAGPLAYNLALSWAVQQKAAADAAKAQADAVKAAYERERRADGAQAAE